MPPTVLKERKTGLFGSPIPGLRSIMLTALGPAYLFGDVGGSLKSQAMFGFNDLDFTNTRYMFSIGLRHIFTNDFSVKLAFHQGLFAGSDTNSRNWQRGLSFSSNILAATAQAEFVFLGGPNARPRVPYTYYAFAGFGVAHSMTKVRDEMQVLKEPWVPSVTTPIVPFGIGYQRKMSEKFYLGSELAWHYAFTDHLDGIITPDSRNNDVIALLTFTFTYKIYEVASRKKSCNCDK